METEERYIRQTILPQIGETGQMKLANAKVLVIGVGGLGCAILPYLASSGIGTLGIVDGDRIDVSNLHRQVLFTYENVGKFKVDIAKEKLKAINPATTINKFPNFLTGDNAFHIFNDFDLIVDATDRISARYLINDACVLLNKPFVYGSIYRFQSQLSVFNYRGGPTYRCLYPTKNIDVASCSTTGVLGTSVAILGSLQANEVMKIILGIGAVLSGRLLVADNLSNEQTQFHFEKNTRIKVTTESFKKEHLYRELDYAFAKANGDTLLDVREYGEKPFVSGKRIVQVPLSKMKTSIDQIPTGRNLFIFCQSGLRSKQAYKILEENSFTDIYCLQESANELNKILQK